MGLDCKYAMTLLLCPYTRYNMLRKQNMPKLVFASYTLHLTCKVKKFDVIHQNTKI